MQTTKSLQHCCDICLRGFAESCIWWSPYLSNKSSNQSFLARLELAFHSLILTSFQLWFMSDCLGIAVRILFMLTLHKSYEMTCSSRIGLMYTVFSKTIFTAFNLASFILSFTINIMGVGFNHQPTFTT